MLKYRHNKQHGKGILKYPNGTVYKGYWAYGLRNGFGVSETADHQKYKGNWLKGLKYNYNILIEVDMEYFILAVVICISFIYLNSYDGNWLNNYPQGKGKLITKSFTYDGNWNLGNKHGKGTLTFNDENMVYNKKYIIVIMEHLQIVK